jgi:hypothetical protein
VSSRPWKVSHKTLVGEALAVLAQFQQEHMSREEFIDKLKHLTVQASEKEPQREVRTLLLCDLKELYPDDTDLVPNPRIRHVAEFFRVDWDTAIIIYRSIQDKGFITLECVGSELALVNVAARTHIGSWTGLAKA